MVITGIPNLIAFLIAPPKAFESGIVTTKPSGLLATAAEINLAISVKSPDAGFL